MGMRVLSYREKKRKDGCRPATSLSATNPCVLGGGFVWCYRRKPSCVTNDPPPLLNRQIRRGGLATASRQQGEGAGHKGQCAHGVQPDRFLSPAVQLLFKGLVTKLDL